MASGMPVQRSLQSPRHFTDGDGTRIADERVRRSDSWCTLEMPTRQFDGEFICVVDEKGRGNPRVLIMGLS